MPSHEYFNDKYDDMQTAREESYKRQTDQIEAEYDHTKDDDLRSKRLKELDEKNMNRFEEIESDRMAALKYRTKDDGPEMEM
jgi:hypothetical protein